MWSERSSSGAVMCCRKPRGRPSFGSSGRCGAGRRFAPPATYFAEQKPKPCRAALATALQRPLTVRGSGDELTLTWPGFGLRLPSLVSSGATAARLDCEEPDRAPDDPCSTAQEQSKTDASRQRAASRCRYLMFIGRLLRGCCCGRTLLRTRSASWPRVRNRWSGSTTASRCTWIGRH